MQITVLEKQVSFVLLGLSLSLAMSTTAQAQVVQVYDTPGTATIGTITATLKSNGWSTIESRGYDAYEATALIGIGKKKMLLKKDWTNLGSNIREIHIANTFAVRCPLFLVIDNKYAHPTAVSDIPKGVLCSYASDVSPSKTDRYELAIIPAD